MRFPALTSASSWTVANGVSFLYVYQNSPIFFGESAHSKGVAILASCLTAVEL